MRKIYQNKDRGQYSNDNEWNPILVDKKQIFGRCEVITLPEI